MQGYHGGCKGTMEGGKERSCVQLEKRGELVYEDLGMVIPSASILC